MEQTFDLFLKQIDENQNLLTDFDFLKKLVEFVIQSEDLFQINHRIFVILRDLYSNLFQRWRYGEIFNETMIWIFETISNLFLKLSSQICEKNSSFLKEIFFDESILNEINRFLEDFLSNNKYFEDQKMKNLENFFRSIQRLERIYSENKQNYLFENIVQCICSQTFLDAFSQSINQENENYGQRFLLNTCTDYIYSHSIDQQHKQSLIQIQKSIISTFTRWIHENSSSFRLWNNRTLILIRQFTFLLTLSIQLNRQIPIEKSSFDYFCQLIDSFVNILYSIGNDSNKIIFSLIGIIIPNLYTMTLANQLEKYLQTKHLTSLFLKLTKIQNDEIQLNSLKILCSITTEQDTKDILYSNNLIQIFLNFLQKTFDDSNQILRFHNLLRCLKNLIQFDKIKDEFIKEKGLTLIIRFVTENQFQTLQVQQPVLEILLSLSFNNEAFQQLQSHIDQIKIGLSSSHHSICYLTQFIIWKLEKEQKFLQIEINEQINSKYDLIFSFTPSDFDFVRQIYDELIKDNYRIYFDQNQGLNLTIDDKCQLINHCQYFLIFISNSYKENLFSRCESTYAFQRQSQIIPLILTPNYRPDGWLNKMISGKISIDFTKLNFDLAIKKLKTEIDRLFKFSKNISIETKINTQIGLHLNEIDEWTNEDVKSFAIKHEFHVLLPLLNQMNGNLLHDLYRMCLTNRETMFHTIKNELAHLNCSTQPLTLLMYLRFLNEIQKYVPTFALI